VIAHHDVCFGCGQANLFGLQLELEATEDGVAGRFFVKQDHQGPPGFAHGGIMASALDEAMALAVHAAGIDARTRRFEVELSASAPVGTFVEVEAALGDGLVATAVARAGDTVLASARGEFAAVG
jgi:acyl-coenzyme A thioesterase PaaI-like protein